jgi:hypothetical protein
MMYELAMKAANYDKLVQQIREIHDSMTHIYGKVTCTECGQKYPCATIKALEGIQND